VIGSKKMVEQVEYFYSMELESALNA